MCGEFNTNRPFKRHICKVNLTRSSSDISGAQNRGSDTQQHAKNKEATYHATLHELEGTLPSTE